MPGQVVTVDYLCDAPGGPLVRFACTTGSVAVLRDAFDRLAAGAPAVIPGLDLVGLASMEFRHGRHGGLRLVPRGRLVYEGDREQWVTRARLLDPLTRPDSAFQFLDYDGAGPVGVVVTTYPDGSF